MGEGHKPVLLKEVLDFLDVQSRSWYLDATIGSGGHALGILQRGGKIVGIDVDSLALERAEKRLKNSGFGIRRYKLIKGNFRNLLELTKNGFETTKFAGVLFDLGVSSLQFEDKDQGFSFRLEAPLDMRMDQNLQVRALDLINGLNKGELYELFTKLGEEKFARGIVDALVSAREVNPTVTTKDLAELVARVYRNHGFWKRRIHPATKVFQALRIAVNDELGAIKESLPQALDLAAKGGKILAISFHSLEDRIVKNTFRQWQRGELGEIITKKPMIPSEMEIVENPRSRSAKLRVFQK